MLFQHFRHFCINANVLHFASQPASFNQVHQTSVQPARTQGNPITKGEYDNQPNIWLHTNPTQTVHTHTHMAGTDMHTVHTHTLVGTQESLYILRLVHPHTHACTHVKRPLRRAEQSHIYKLTLMVICCWRIRV